MLWAGSDDGLVHVSRNNGRTWQNVTPSNWPEGCINSIDISTHEPGRVTIAMYRYRQGDFTPYLYQTNDYGRTWRRIADGTNGIPANHFTRVVREDPARRGLLFAGTEFGLYASFDDGARWQSMQLGLPRTPVSDMKFYRDDLIVTTQGRGFWILDNLAPAAHATAGHGRGDARDPVQAGTGVPGGRSAADLPLLVPRGADRAGHRRGDQRGGRRACSRPRSQPGTAPPRGRGAWRRPRWARWRGRRWRRRRRGAARRWRRRAAGGGAGRPRGRGRRRAGAAPPAPAPPGAVPPPGAATPPAAGVAAGGGRGGRGGAGGPGGGAPAGGYASAVQGMNRAGWSNLRTPTLFTVPQGTVLWGGGGGGGGPKVPLGTYTVKVSSGAWSQTQTFTLGGDPRFEPVMTEAESAEQFKLSSEVGQMIATLYADLAKIRDAKRQAAAVGRKAPGGNGDASLGLNAGRARSRRSRAR